MAASGSRGGADEHLQSKGPAYAAEAGEEMSAYAGARSAKESIAVLAGSGARMAVAIDELVKVVTVMNIALEALACDLIALKERVDAQDASVEPYDGPTFEEVLPDAGLD